VDGPSGISSRIFSLAKKISTANALALNRSAHRHLRSGWKQPNYSEKQSEPERIFLYLCYLRHCCWCWRAIPVAINIFLSLRCADHHLIRIMGEWGLLVSASPVMKKRRGPAGGKQLPGERHTSSKTSET
jgi:hypothetical protein